MKKLKLTIPEPCHEKWDEMLPSEKGKFCNACQKTVVDFTGMSERQLAEFFKRPTGSVCGRFHADQLDRELDIPRKRIPWIKYFFQFALPAFLFSAKGYAQGKPVIKQVTSHTNQTPGALATQKKKAQTHHTVHKRTGSIDHESRLLAPREDSIPNLAKKVTHCSEVSVPQVLEGRLGGMVVVRHYSRDRIMTNIKTLVDTAFARFSVYPNPVKSNAALTINSKRLEKGDYVLSIVGSNGVVLQTQEITIEKKQQEFELLFKGTTAGLYFVQLKNRKTGRGYVERVVVRE